MAIRNSLLLALSLTVMGCGGGSKEPTAAELEAMNSKMHAQMETMKLPGKLENKNDPMKGMSPTMPVKPMNPGTNK